MNGNTKLGVMVSGGAPMVHLAAGALCAFHENGLTFDVIGTAGAGALPGLLYAAPKGGNAEAALKSVVNLNVFDSIYRLIPANFKVFFKYGPFSQFFYDLAHSLPRFTLKPEERYKNAPQRLFNDSLDLLLTAITPTTLNPRSKSVLTRVQVVNNLVDWNALRTFPGQFYLNAFSFSAPNELVTFDKATLTPEHFYAALAMPWLYPPTEAAGKLYTEGASHDPSGLEALLQTARPDVSGLDSVIMIDTIGPDMWVDPESLYEALQLTIMDPVVTLGENIVALYSLMESVLNAANIPVPKIYRLKFDIPQWERGKLMEWSYANALTLWDIGYETAGTFYSEMVTPNLAQPAVKRPSETYRYMSTLTPDSREEDFLQFFGVKLPVVPPPPGQGLPAGIINPFKPPAGAGP